MRNKIRVAMLVLAISFSAAMGTYATVDVSELSLGGIGLDSDANYVTKIYGNPDKVVEKSDWGGWSGPYKWLYYGDSVEIMADKWSDGTWRVMHVVSTGNNGFATLKNVQVGSPVADVIKAYGYPDEINRGNTLIYFVDKNKRFQKMFFEVKNGKVTEIWVGRTME